MSDYIDHRWYGAPAAMTAALQGQPNVIGPVVLDGVAYATVRSETPLPVPPGLSAIGPELSRVLHGTWLGDAPMVPAEVSNFQGRTALRHAGLFEGADTAVEAMAQQMADGGDEVGAAVLREAWVKASFVRASPLVAQIALLLEVSPAGMDALFVAAAKIQV